MTALDRRRAGLLLHPTSLPGHPDHGDFSHSAYRFIEFLQGCGLSVWQTLPLGPTADGSPYQGLSVHAGNPRLISLEWLLDRGWLMPVELEVGSPDGRGHCLQRAHARFAAGADPATRSAFERFVRTCADWLEDFALYMALRREQGGAPWMHWPEPLRTRDSAALAAARERLVDAIDRVRFEQFVFFAQWLELKRYAHDRGILLFGDMPLFVAHDSAEVWAARRYFAVGPAGSADKVAGVPPDAFAETGQLWGNPLYDWEALRADGFQWWIRRMETQLSLFDLVRIDHFRGLEACWEIPGEAETALEGRWVEAPGAALLQAFVDAFARLPLVAEDLGTITPAVTALRDRFDLPGMKVLQFAFDANPDNPYLPHNHGENCVVYTGTHDNDTTLGWYRSLDRATRRRVDKTLGNAEQPMPWPLIHTALASPARIAVIPLQDLLGLGSEHRMNTPGTPCGNWRWRFQAGDLDDGLRQHTRALVETYGRLAE